MTFGTILAPGVILSDQGWFSLAPVFIIFSVATMYIFGSRIFPSRRNTGQIRHTLSPTREDIKQSNFASDGNSDDVHLQNGKLENGKQKGNTNMVASKTQKMVYIRDVLYEYDELFDLARCFVDTPEFQSLRDIRQLGSASYVFPSAVHTRFEHSLGVCHLVGRLLRHLSERQPEMFPKDPRLRTRFIRLVQLAGLLHDVGHYCYSHCFDDKVAAKLGLPHHEERGVRMIREMVKKYKIPLDDREVEFICGLILGSDNIQPTWVRSVIHDKESELDCDKLDYLNRDQTHVGLGKPIQIERLILNTRILATPIQNNPADVGLKSSKDDQNNIGPGPVEIDKKISDSFAENTDAKGDFNAWEEGLNGWFEKEALGNNLRVCYHRKVFFQVCDVFQSRYRLFREVYRHRVIVGVDEMVADLLLLLSPVIGSWIKQGIRPTDSAIASLQNWIDFVPDALLPPKVKLQCRQLHLRLKSRQHYRLTQTDNAPDAQIHVRLALSALADDPVEKVWFFDNSAFGNSTLGDSAVGNRTLGNSAVDSLALGNSAFVPLGTKDAAVSHIRVHEVTKLMGASPRIASETIHYRIVKSPT
jgi:HD superfamily phosphohydrolase